MDTRKQGVWMVLTWKDGMTDRFWFPHASLAEQYRRREHITPTGRLKAPLMKLEMIPAVRCDDAGFLIKTDWGLIDRVSERDMNDDR